MPLPDKPIFFLFKAKEHAFDMSLTSQNGISSVCPGHLGGSVLPNPPSARCQAAGGTPTARSLWKSFRQTNPKLFTLSCLFGRNPNKSFWPRLSLHSNICCLTKARCSACKESGLLLPRKLLTVNFSFTGVCPPLVITCPPPHKLRSGHSIP